jgi:hypothetical protein
LHARHIPVVDVVLIDAELVDPDDGLLTVVRGLEVVPVLLNAVPF